ncbi:MAG: hypothetical protein DRN81_03610 [Thermoproteota archaeon]|nr:MAG: hypothetical protein DRN81_03610 [Candidatus Korarchaeota archaeon]
MRIITLAEQIIVKNKPSVGFLFSCIGNICTQFLYAKEIAPITELAVTEGHFSTLFKECQQISWNIDATKFMSILEALDGNSGIIITAHWLLYIFDLQERAEYIWTHFPLFYSLAKTLKQKQDSKHIENKYILQDSLRDPWTGRQFKHRFYTAKPHLLKETLTRTIKNLSDHNGSLTAYINDKLTKCDHVTSENWIRLTAVALYQLTYETSNKTEDLYEYAKNRNFIQNGNIEPWKIKVGGNKRLWSALRDYIMDPYLRKLLLKNMDNENPAKTYLENMEKSIIESESHLNQLELPGDIWNQKFQQEHMKKLKNMKIPRKIIVKDARTSIRRLYHWLQQSQFKKQVQQERLYPIYIDATFKLRNKHLEHLTKNSTTMKQQILNTTGNPQNEKEIVQAYKIIRQKLSYLSLQPSLDK